MIHYTVRIENINIYVRDAASMVFGTQVRGFAPGRSRRIFRAKKKILSTPSFVGEVKQSVPCRSFTACKKIPKCNVEIGI